MRPDYHVDRHPRPLYRGQLFGFVYTSGLWLAISALYLGYFMMFHEESRGIFDVPFRFLFCRAVYRKMRSSHLLHNSDKVYAGLPDRKVASLELDAFLEDGFQISLIMTVAYVIIASKMHFPGDTLIGALLEAGATTVSAVLLYCFYPDEMLDYSDIQLSHTLRILERIRLSILIFQFVIVMGWYFVYFISYDDTGFRQIFGKSIIIWAVYGMGMICHTCKPLLKSSKFGGHELFHFFVMAGHCTVIAADLLLI